jgi:leucyl/phenylalanyl-tRNA--protein transferase
LNGFFCAEVVLRAYIDGYFPMAEHRNGNIYWHSPDPRAIFPLYEIQASRKDRQSFRKYNFTFTTNKRFDDVIRYCAERDDTWINDEIKMTYIELHELGYAHSIETYHEDKLVGGLYGVSIAGAFFGESMFNILPNASKAAFYYLIEHLKSRGFLLLDSQYINPFTKQLGAIEIRKSTYLKLLKQALNLEVKFT